PKGNAHLQVFARPKAGVPAEQAAADLTRIAQERNAQRRVSLLLLQEQVVGKSGKPLWVLLGAVGFLLLIACVNVANLLIARGARRAQEFATRVALGASRARLVRQLAVESLVLSLSGGGLGLLLAAWGQTALVKIAPSNTFPRLGEVHLDGW